MKPHQDRDGTWGVVGEDGVLLVGGMTNAEVWRFIDRASREPINRSQEVSDWVFRKMADRG